jgi:hypothetical protein
MFQQSSRPIIFKLNFSKAIREARTPTIRSFVSLCNFFRTHIKDVTTLAALFFWLKNGPILEAPMRAFLMLQKQPMSEPVMVFP